MRDNILDIADEQLVLYSQQYPIFFKSKSSKIYSKLKAIRNWSKKHVFYKTKETQSVI